MSSSLFVTRRLRRILAFGLAWSLTAGWGGWAHAAVERPDLVADPVERPILQTDAGEDGAGRLLLRFDGHVHNAGTGPLEVRRHSGVVEQVLRGGPSGDLEALALPAGAMVFENTDGHDHWHLQRIARYSLWDAARTGQVAPAMKVGFCLLDSEHVAGGHDDAYRENCAPHQPAAPVVTMGVSPGWRDLYRRTLPFQWVDVSEVQPGPYALRAELDPYDVVAEADEVNVPADLDVEVPGFRAVPVDVSGPSPLAVTLATQASGAPAGAAPVLRIVSPPAHGTLSRPAGTWFAGADLTYTGSGAPDRFVVAAADPVHPFPRHPGRATVLVNGAGTERVALSGVPARLRAGLTTVLRADVLDAAGPGVTWTASAGTIDAAGRFTAPDTPPAGGTVTVTARAAGGAADAMEIEIVPPPGPPEPAPSAPIGSDAAPASAAPAPAAGPSGAPAARRPAASRRVPIGSVRIRRIGPRWAVAVVPRTAGRLRVTLLAGRRRLGTCTVRAVAARRPVSCRLRARRGATAIAVTLVRRDGRVERRRLRLG